jgi:hypothetical protein
MANRFTKYLTNLLSRTGRIIQEDGNSFNEADYLALKQREEISSQSLLGYAYIASWRSEIPAGETRDFVLEIPAGIRVYFHSCSHTVVGGNLEWELRTRPDAGYLVADTIKGWNVDSDLYQESQASIIEVDGLTTGSEFRRENILYPAGTGTNVTSSVYTSADAIPQYSTNSIPVLRLKNVNADAMVIVVDFVWAEREIDA